MYTIQLYRGDIMYEDLFCERLTKLRMTKGVSAREMSLSIGQSANYIFNIESKRSLPSMTVFFYICDYLEISPQEFFDFGTNHPVLLKDIIKDLKELTDEQMFHLAAIIKDMKK